jgi:DNA repair exonuclease SbcCD ATPase subunit
LRVSTEGNIGVKHVSLQSVDLTNFKSFTSAHVDLRRGPGLRMVFGENRKKPRLGANGAGKSTIWDAVCFCLTGRSMGRKTSTGGKRASELMMTGKKSMGVETTWLIDGEVRTIKRSYPPERVYIDGEISDQRAVDELMGLSRDCLLASVIFGQDRPLFIDLPVPERGDLLDEVLGLGFWMRAADLATSRWNAAGVEMQRLQRELARLDGALAELPSEESLYQAVAAYEEQREQQLAGLRAQRRELDGEYRNLRRSLVTLQDHAEREEVHVKLRDELRELESKQRSEIAVLESDIAGLDGDIKFFGDTGECPTCGQEIVERHAEACINEMTGDRAEKLDLLAAAQEALAGTWERLDVQVNDLRALADKTRDRHRLSLDVANKKSSVGMVDNRIQLILGQENPHEGQMRTVAARRIALDDQLSAKRGEESALSTRIDRLDFWRQGFRRVRVFCLSRVLAELEIATMSEARSLGLMGWHIGYSGETETKSGTVRVGVQVVVEEDGVRRDFDAWSPGEGQRIRCASALGLGSLVQRHSGVWYDLEAWDEPSAWLSAEGIDDLFESLRERAYSRGKSIWVVDPRAGLSHGGFDEVWNVIKDDDGSRIEVVRSDGGMRMEPGEERAGDGRQGRVHPPDRLVRGSEGELAPVRRVRRAAAV